jgi:hypothetical protein
LSLCPFALRFYGFCQRFCHEVHTEACDGFDKAQPCVYS